MGASRCRVLGIFFAGRNPVIQLFAWDGGGESDVPFGWARWDAVAVCELDIEVERLVGAAELDVLVKEFGAFGERRQDGTGGVCRGRSFGFAAVEHKDDRGERESQQ